MAPDRTGFPISHTILENSIQNSLPPRIVKNATRSHILRKSSRTRVRPQVAWGAVPCPRPNEIPGARNSDVPHRPLEATSTSETICGGKQAGRVDCAEIVCKGVVEEICKWIVRKNAGWLYEGGIKGGWAEKGGLGTVRRKDAGEIVAE